MWAQHLPLKITFQHDNRQAEEWWTTMNLKEEESNQEKEKNAIAN